MMAWLCNHSPRRTLIALLILVLVPAWPSHRAEAVSAYGVITTVAGTGTAGHTGDGGAATSAQIRTAHLAVAPAGSPYAGEVFFTQDDKVRRISTDGTVTLFAGGGSGFNELGGRLDVDFPTLSGIDVGDDGTVYLAQAGTSGAIFTIDSAGRVQTLVASSTSYNTIEGLAVNSQGTVYFAARHSHKVFRVTAAGAVSTFYGTGVMGCRPSGATFETYAPYDVAVSANDATVYIAERTNAMVWAVASDLSSRSMIGGNSTSCNADNAEIDVGFPAGIDVDASGAVYVVVHAMKSTRAHQVLRIAAGQDEVVAGTGTGGFSGDGLAAVSAQLSGPQGAALASDGTLYVTDTEPTNDVNARIRMLRDVPVPVLSGTAGNATASLSWTAVSGVTGYHVWRSHSGGVATKVTSSALSQATTSYADSGLTNGVAYSYYLTAVDTSGNTSPPSNTVELTPSQPAVNVTLAGTGEGTVTSTPAGISCGNQTGSAANDCTEAFGESPVTIVASAPDGHHFAGWSGCDTPSYEATCQVATTSTKNLTVTFNTGNQLRLERTGGGRIVSSPAGVDCSTGCAVQLGSFADGASVTLTATPDSGMTFGGWAGCDAATGTTCTMTMSSSKTLIAQFVAPGNNLGVSVTGSGSVSSSPAGINTCRAGVECLAQFNGNVTLTATADEGHTFMGWGNCPSADGNACTADLSSTGTSVSATFAAPSYGLVVTKQGTGYGRVYSSGGGFDCVAVESSCSATYGNGQTVTLVAEPLTGSRFDGWTGACNGWQAGDTTCTVSMTAVRNLQARFVLLDRDGDGVADVHDACPDEAAPGGCPPPPSPSPATPTPSGPGLSELVEIAAPSTALPSSQRTYRVELAAEGDPVNVIFGNFTHQHIDLGVESIGLPVNWMRSYNSVGPTDGPLGWGWSSNFDLRLDDRGATVAIKRADGRHDVHHESGTGFAAPTGSQDELRRIGDGWELTTGDDVVYGFSDEGRLLHLTDVNGNRTQLGYDASGNLATLVDSVGRAWRITSDVDGRFTSVTDPAGRVVRYGYDAGGRLTTVTDTKGGHTRYAYDDDHRITRITDANGNLFVAHAFDDEGRVVRQIDARGLHRFAYEDGRTTYTDPTGGTTVTEYDDRYQVTRKVDELGNAATFTYDSNGFVTREVDQLGNVRSYTFDEDGNTTSVTDAAGTIRMAYDADGRLLSSTDRRGARTTYRYDAKGHLTSIIDPLGGVRGISYDRRGLPIEETDPAGAKVTTSYDGHGNAVSLRDANGAESRMTYDRIGRLVTHRDANGGRTVYAYDAAGLVVSTVAPDGAVTRYGYDRVGRRTSVTDPAGARTTYRYDDANDLVSMTDPTGRTTRFTYDRLGRPATRVLPDGTAWHYRHDPAGRLVEQTSPLGHRTTWSRDALGRVVRVVDAAGGVSSFAYDASGHLVREVDAAGGTVAYRRDRNGNVIARTDPNGNTTTYRHDAANRVTQVVDAAGRTTSMTYDRAGRLTRSVDPAGVATVYAYDAVGNLTMMRSGEVEVRYRYDAKGSLAAMADPLGTTTYRRDRAGRILGVDGPAGALTYGYDRAGRRRAMDTGLGNYGYRYDAAGRLAAVTLDGDLVVSYRHDAAGRIERILSANGLSTRRHHDRDGRLVGLTTVRATRSGNEPVATTRYALDARGNRLREKTVRPDVVVRGTHRYDALSRLTATDLAWGRERRTYRYAYDAAGNRTRSFEDGKTTSYGYDSSNRLLRAGRHRVTHDGSGRLTSDGIRDYRYDGLGRLVLVSTPQGSIHYSVDGAGNRVSERMGARTTSYTLDLAASLVTRVGRTDRFGSTAVVFAAGLAAECDEDGTMRFFHGDALGSPTITTGQDGDVLGTALLQPFGRRAAGRVPAFGFAGEPQSQDAGLVHLRARDYHPALGRFLTPDPHPPVDGMTQSHNPYQYAYNNPVNWVDPTGMVAESSGGKLALVDEEGRTRASGSLRYIAATAGIIATGGGNIIATGGLNIIATGGGNIIATGGGNLVDRLAGIIATGGGNLTSQIKAQIIATGGGNIIATGGGNLVAKSLAGIIATGGGNIIATGGGNIIATGGGNIIATGGGNIIATGGLN